MTEASDAAGASDAARGPAAAPEPGHEPEHESGHEAEWDEDALRRLLRDSVSGIEPTPGSLDHLRHAVPARRARRRQMLIGAAAAVLLGGAAIPALLQTDLVPGRDKPMHAAGHSQSHGPGDNGAEGERSAGNAGSDQRQAGKDGEDNRGAGSTVPGTAGQSAGPDPSSSLGAVSPTCTRDQLGAGTATKGEADAQGRVYGSFRVANISAASCTVEGGGIVAAAARGRASSGDIQVLDHTTGDAATGLPDPATASDELVLEPNEAYVVRFAWIPREGGGPTGCSTSSPPPGGGSDGGTDGGDAPMGTSGGESEGGEGTPDGSGGTTGTGDGDATGGDGTGGGSGSEEPAASVAVSHTPDVGDPSTADVVLPGACAGTLYRTGVLPAP